ncbi:MAG: SusC/RagA family TonB-linked outer membrane protein [Gemmatimonadetes bacterium]|nr:SusC/RagA family TonB-linked outer membrane protein [Gemmatimonadota bacterium]
MNTLQSPITRLLTMGGVLACLCLPGQAFAQGTVNGKVVDQSGQRPIPLATVVVQGTTLQAQTDVAGRFVIRNVPVGIKVLSVRIIGFRPVQQSVEVRSGASTVADFTLEAQSVMLDQIVVTGTAGGTQRRAVGTDVSRIAAAADVVLATGAQTAQSLISGRAAGVQVQLPSGEVGGGGAIRMRGVGSLTLGTDPILFVDGVRVNNSAGGASGTRSSRDMSRMNDFKAEDIESIEIIKGPAAATLYGTEASAGVIQIITKRGVSGAPKFEIVMRQGVNFLMNPVSRLDWSYFINPGVDITCGPATGPACLSAPNPAKAGVLEKWHPILSDRERGYSEWLQKGPIQEYQMNVTGGQDRVRYYVGGNYGYSEGYVDWNWFRDGGLRANLDVNLSSNMDVKINTSVSKSNRRAGMTPSPYSLPTAWPYGHPLRLQTRGYYSATPEQERQIEVTSVANRSTNSIQLLHKPFKWLNQRVVLGYDFTDEGNDVLFNALIEGATHPVFGALAQGDRRGETIRSTYTSGDYSLTGRANILPALASATSAGMQYYKRQTETQTLRGQNFAAPGLTAFSAAAVTSASGSWVENASLGLYIQQQLEWKNRIFLTAALRGDDNSAFGVDYNAALYPKLSASWVLNEEPFWPLPVINTFRVRGAWGKAGRQPSTFAAVTLYNPGTGPGNLPVVFPGSLGNPDLGPEVGEEMELGFEASALDDRVGINFSYYNKVTKDALLSQPVANSTGFFSSKTVNLGKIQNNGIEAALSLGILRLEKLRWDFSFNIATNKNRILDLGPNYVPVTIGNHRNLVGYPIGSEWHAKVVSAQWDRVNKKAINPMCQTADGGTKPCDATGYADQIYTGRSGTPKFFGGLSSTVTLFRHLRLFGNVDYVGGHIIQYHGLGAAHPVMNNTYEMNGDPLNGVDPDPVVWFYARSPNPSFSAGNAHVLGDYNAGFARIRDLSVSWDLPASVARRIGASRASFTASGKNLWFLWWEQKKRFGRLVGDPEAGVSGSTGGVAQFYPSTSVSASLRLSF